MYRHFGTALPSREQIRIFLEQLYTGNVPPAPARPTKGGEGQSGTGIASLSTDRGKTEDRPPVPASEPTHSPAPSPDNTPVQTSPVHPSAGERSLAETTASQRTVGATTHTARSAFSLTRMLSQGRESHTEAARMKGESTAVWQEPVTQEDLGKTWERLCQAVGREKRIGLHTAMNAADVRLEDASVVGITVSSAAAAHELEENMLELLGRLRTALRNTALTHRIEVDQSIREHLPYTPREKYDYLRSKNPLIEKMRHDLDLNIDF